MLKETVYIVRGKEELWKRQKVTREMESWEKQGISGGTGNHKRNKMSGKIRNCGSDRKSYKRQSHEEIKELWRDRKL